MSGNKILNKDFEDFKSHLQNSGVPETVFDSESLVVFKHIHKVVYSFVLLNKRIQVRGVCKEFFDEIISDYIQIIPQIARGYNKISIYLLRDILENCLKYIYYHDHKIEYTWLKETDKYYPSMGSLLENLSLHPKLKKHVEKLNLKNKIKHQYFDLSKFVHSRSCNYMQLSKYLKAIKFEKKSLEEYLQEFSIISDTVFMLIILFNLTKFSKLDIKEKRIILNSMSREYKKYITSL